MSTKEALLGEYYKLKEFLSFLNSRGIYPIRQLWEKVISVDCDVPCLQKIHAMTVTIVGKNTYNCLLLSSVLVVFQTRLSLNIGTKYSMKVCTRNMDWKTGTTLTT